MLLQTCTCIPYTCIIVAAYLPNSLFEAPRMLIQALLAASLGPLGAKLPPFWCSFGASWDALGCFGAMRAPCALLCTHAHRVWDPNWTPNFLHGMTRQLAKQMRQLIAVQFAQQSLERSPALALLRRSLRLFALTPTEIGIQIGSRTFCTR